MTESIHTIPVPQGWSVEQAWEAITREDPLPKGRPACWVNIVCEGKKFIGFLKED